MFKKITERLALRKIRGFRALDGWLTDQEALGLYQTAAALPPNATIVEIGSWQGKSTYCLSKGLTSGTVYAIDPFNASGGFDVDSQKEYVRRKGSRDLLMQFKNNMSGLGVLSRIEVKQGYAYEFHNQFHKIDFLFIDGDHSIKGCQSDFDLYAHKIVPGGFIAFHDYYPEDPEPGGPTFVIRNSILSSNSFKFHKQYDSLWIAQKK